MARNILLVDDEEGIRKVLGISLADRGYAVTTAANGRKALQLFKGIKPSIVLTDIKMPGMDGIELLQKIKELDPDTEVIMITGHGDLELAIQSLKFDATDFITKPINDDVLDIALKRANERIVFKAKLREYTDNLEKLVEEKTKQLVSAERLAAVGQTVAGLAHAVKNMAGGLKGGTFVLEKGIELNNNTYLHQGWDMVKGNVEKLRIMALDLLSYSKEREPDYQLCDPNEPVRQVAGLMKPEARERGVILEVDLDDTLPKIWFDPEGICRCLLNLVSNAIDACTDFECSAEKKKVILRTLKSQGWAAEYQVTDTGCGMDGETKDKVFQSFFSTKGSKGTGLGLMITKKIVEEHGGTISVESRKEKGSRFIVRLPERQQPIVAPPEDGALKRT
jgi:signal transduction histidine kinase